MQDNVMANGEKKRENELICTLKDISSEVAIVCGCITKYVLQQISQGLHTNKLQHKHSNIQRHADADTDTKTQTQTHKYEHIPSQLSSGTQCALQLNLRNKTRNRLIVLVVPVPVQWCYFIIAVALSVRYASNAINTLAAPCTVSARTRERDRIHAHR